MTQTQNHEYAYSKHGVPNFGVRVHEYLQLYADHDPDPVYTVDAFLAQTAFAEAVIEGICAFVSNLVGQKFRAANVSFLNTEGIGHRLDLIIKVDASWDEIDEWEYATLDEVLEWAKNWNDRQWAEYTQHIFHAMVPIRP